MDEITEVNLSRFRRLTAEDVFSGPDFLVTARGRGPLFILRRYVAGVTPPCAHTWQWSKFRNATVGQFDEALETGSILLTVDNVSRFVAERPSE